MPILIGGYFFRLVSHSARSFVIGMLTKAGLYACITLFLQIGEKVHETWKE